MDSENRGPAGIDAMTPQRERFTLAALFWLILAICAWMAFIRLLLQLKSGS